MKFFVYLNGELNNVVKYFFSFVNVFKDDCNLLNGKYGEFYDCKWKFWQYVERINVVKYVEYFKEKIIQLFSSFNKEIQSNLIYCCKKVQIRI